VPEYPPPTVRVTRDLRTGETKLGVTAVMDPGEIDTPRFSDESETPLTVTVAVMEEL
jgi:hypothetical protein